MRRPSTALLGLALLAVGRLLLAARLGLSADEALAWTHAQAQPWADPLVALGWGAPQGLGLRFGAVVLSAAAAAVAGLVGGGLGVALVGSMLAGLVTSGVGPFGGLWLGWLLVHVAAQKDLPWMAAMGVFLAVVAHASGLATALVLFGLASEQRRRWLGPLGCTGLLLCAWSLLPGVATRLAADLSLHPPDLDSLGPLYGFLLPFSVAGALFLHRTDPAGWWLGIPGVLLGVGVLGNSLLAAGPVSVLALSALSLGARWRRGASVVVGVNAMVSGLVMLHLVWPLGNPSADPRAAFVGGAVLADSVEAWGVEPVYAANAGDAALLYLHTGLETGPLPDEPILPSLYVRVWSADLPLPTDAQGLPRSGPNTVSAWLDTADPRVAVPVRRWQVYQLGDAP